MNRFHKTNTINPPKHSRGQNQNQNHCAIETRSGSADTLTSSHQQSCTYGAVDDVEQRRFGADPAAVASEQRRSLGNKVRNKNTSEHLISEAHLSL